MRLPSVAHLDQWFGCWAMRESDFRGLEAAIRNIDLHAHIANEKRAAETDDSADDKPRPYEMVGDIALINLIGPMTKYGSSLTGGGTVATRRAVRTATADDAVGGIFLRVHSPGGSVSGTGDLADDVRAAAAVKPVLAYGEDLIASAAYWAASQATAIHASANSEIGSIGTYAIIKDWSKVYDEAGVKVHVVRAGAFKGVGIDGTPVTDEHLAELQREINAINDLFVGAVAAGRRMDRTIADGLADGRVHIASGARTLGLIDEVGTIDAAMSALREMVAAKAARRANMSKNVIPSEDAGATELASAKATIAEIKAINADANFVLACVEAGLTVDQVRAMASSQAVAAAAAKQASEENAALKLRVEKLEKCGGAYRESDGGGSAGGTAEANARKEWRDNEQTIRRMGYSSEVAWVEAQVALARWEGDGRIKTLNKASDN